MPSPFRLPSAPRSVPRLRRLAAALVGIAGTAASAGSAPETPLVRFDPPPTRAPAPTPEPRTPAALPTAVPEEDWTGPREVRDMLELQVALGRRSFSCGPIDGVFGPQSEAALRAWQESQQLPATGQLDSRTRPRLLLEAPPLTRYTVTAADLARLQPLAPTWLGKSEQTALEYETLLELVAERFHASQRQLQRLNPDADWANLSAGASVLVPAVSRAAPRAPAAHLHVQLGARVLQARDATGTIVAHFPVSIAREMDKRPVGELQVTVVIPQPDYTFNPAIFPESAEAATLDRSLLLPPGPNNPVGVAWIGLNRPGYGIHGTPIPEHVGRTQSHGCFRLANWDALTLLELAWTGLPVFIDP